MRLIYFALVLAACGPNVTNNGGNDAGADACIGLNCPGTDASTTECDPSQSVACNGNNVVQCNADGTFGTVVQSCGAGMACTAGTCTNACTADGVDLVYVVDEQNDFLSFDPRKLPGDPFTKIGTLNCPAKGQSIQQPAPLDPTPMPFSMSVDRDGKAWVLYTSGELFEVSLTTAACTAANNTVGAGGMDLFGMGFVTDTAGGMTEKLYMAGGNDDPSQTPRKLGYDDTHGGILTPVVVGNIAASSDYSPELTGTSEAKLYGFFPNLSKPAFVQEIDKTTGAAVGMTWNLGTTGLGAQVTDWAFAQWGGTFYVFVTTADSNGNNRNSTVRAINRTTNQYSVVLQNLQYFIDGAGVSTCAPVVVQ